MARPTAPDGAPPPGDPDDREDGYDAPTELVEEGGGGRPPSSIALKLGVVAALVLVVAGALLAYRAHHRRKVVAEALTQADALLRLDTAAGYRAAASLLEPIAQLDPLQGASVRAFALAMLFADYRQAETEPEIEALLLGPGRADVVPVHAQLAMGALALGRREVGNVMTAVARAGDGPWPLTLQARAALLAGNVDAALAPAASAAAEGAFPPGLALHGDALRRLRRDAPAARAAYEAALAASPTQPRAAFGLAKLALSSLAPAEEAEGALRRVMEDREGTPAAERGRATVHYAALRLRAGDRAAATAALDALGLEGPARSWAERAATVAAEARGAYRAVQGAPPALQSASDDDPGELSPAPPPPPPPAPPAAKPAAAKAVKRAVTAKRTATEKKPVAKKPVTRKATTAKRPVAKKPARRAP